MMIRRLAGLCLSVGRLVGLPTIGAIGVGWTQRRPKLRQRIFFSFFGPDGGYPKQTRLKGIFFNYRY